MPHLTIEYSANLEDEVEMSEFCAAMRDAMIATGIFPLGGIRVRAFACNTYVIADGDPAYAYVHMTCRVGHGRAEDVRLDAATVIYDAAEAFLHARVTRPLAISLDLDELDPATSLKRYNTIHSHLAAKG